MMVMRAFVLNVPITTPNIHRLKITFTGGGPVTTLDMNNCTEMLDIWSFIHRKLSSRHLNNIEYALSIQVA